MAKSKRKSSRRKAAPERIRQAQYAKSKGLLSKRANLQGGKISPAVARKLQELEDIRAVPTYQLREGAKRAEIMDPAKTFPVKIKPREAAEYKRRGFFVSNGHVVSDDPKRVSRGLQEGRLGGAVVQPPKPSVDDGVRRVAPGRVERISLTKHKIRNFKDLKDALENNRLELEAKRPDETYSFTLFDYHPKPSRTTEPQNKGKRVHSVENAYSVFFTDEELLAYLEKYDMLNPDGDEDNEAFEHFELYRMLPPMSLGPTPDWVYDRHRKRGTGSLRAQQDRRLASLKRRSKAAKEKRTVQPADLLREKDRLRKVTERGSETPAKREDRLRKDREAKKAKRASKRS